MTAYGCALDIRILAAKTKFQSGKAAENSGRGFAKHIQLTNMFRISDFIP